MRDGVLWIGRYSGVPPRGRLSVTPDNKGMASTILDRQIQHKLIASVAAMNTIDNEISGGILLDSRNLASFVMDIGRINSPDPDEQVSARDLVAAFDVDGPCLVAVPLCGDWEMLPRPSLRSKSVCWVVERVAHAKEPTTKDESRQKVFRQP